MESGVRIDRIQNIPDSENRVEFDIDDFLCRQGDAQTISLADVDTRTVVQFGESRRERDGGRPVYARSAVQVIKVCSQRDGGLAHTRAVVEITERHIGRQALHHAAVDESADLRDAGVEVDQDGRPVSGEVNAVGSIGPAVDGSVEGGGVLEHEPVVPRTADDGIDAGRGIQHTGEVRDGNGAIVMEGEYQVRVGRHVREVEGVAAAGIDNGVAQPVIVEVVGVRACAAL